MGGISSLRIAVTYLGYSYLYTNVWGGVKIHVDQDISTAKLKE